MLRSAKVICAAALTAVLAISSTVGAASESNAAYFLIEIDVKEPEAFNSYAEKAAEMVGRYGGTFVVLGGRVRSVEGAPPAGNVVVIKFEDYDMAEQWLDSEEYAQIKTIRHNSATTRQILAEALEDQ